MDFSINLPLLREKIYAMHNAIMYIESNVPMRVPNSIVHVTDIDDDGRLWFASGNLLYKIENDIMLPVHLYFHRKGLMYHVEVSGRACIVEDVDDCYKKHGVGKDEWLFSMVIEEVLYRNAREHKKNYLEELMENGYRWFLRTFGWEREEGGVLRRMV